MGRKTHFRESWLQRTDNQGHLIGNWCERVKSDDFSGYCKICKKTIRCDNQGLQQILQHSDGKSHILLSKDILSGSQLSFSLSATESTPNRSDTRNVGSSLVSCTSNKEKATIAELIWSLKVVQSHYSYASCDNLKHVLEAMFPGNIPPEFSMSSTKVSYLISEACGPYFHKLVLSDVQKNATLYALLYDESTNSQAKKELDIKIRYWSSARKEICTHHLKTYLMGHADANSLSQNLLKLIEENDLSLRNMVMLGSDGPNVNKAVFNIINTAVLNLKRPGLINIGFCNLHVVHNAFGKGISVFGQEAVDLIIDLKMWFKLSAARGEDYASIQYALNIPEHKFLKHVECRWLTLLPAINRVVEQWPAITSYFMKEAPKIDPKVSNNTRYRRIKSYLSNSVLVQLHFLSSVAPVFNSFLIFFQREEPLIHLLTEHLWSLLTRLMLRFLKAEAVPVKRETDLCNVDIHASHNQLSDLDMGVEARTIFNKLKPLDQIAVKEGVAKFYAISTDYLIKKLPVKNEVLNSCRFLNPAHRNSLWGLKAAQTVAEKLPLNLDFNALADEWRIYSSDVIPDDWWFETDKDGKIHYKRIDHYWQKVFEMQTAIHEQKYPLLMVLVKATTCISHGNASVERGFSQSGKNTTSNRVNLSETSINAMKSVADGLKLHCEGEPHQMPITKEFLRLGQQARKQYVLRLEEKKREKQKLIEAKKCAEKAREEAKREQQKLETKLMQKRDKHQEILQRERELHNEEQEQTSNLNVGTSLFKQGNDKLCLALKKKDIKEISVAQAMLETAGLKISAATDKLSTMRAEQKVIEKRKQSLLDAFLVPKKLKSSTNLNV